MKIVITGGSGLIGSALTELLVGRGHDVRTVSRSADRGDIVWDLDNGSIDAEGLEESDAIVHLAGESIAGRWTAKKKQRILSSRVRSTALLADAVAHLDAPPTVFVSGSAIGYYGDTGGEPVDESGPAGDDFLADVTRQWERAAAPIANSSRLCFARTGIVLSPSGGALGPLVLATKFFVGGPLGSGRQIWSWISLQDEVRALAHMIDTEIEGPVNLTAPNPVSQREVVTALGKVLRRPTFMPAPKFAVTTVLGEMAEALIFTSANVVPGKLSASGFEFEHSHVREALEAVLDR